MSGAPVHTVGWCCEKCGYSTDDLLEVRNHLWPVGNTLGLICPECYAVDSFVGNATSIEQYADLLQEHMREMDGVGLMVYDFHALWEAVHQSMVERRDSREG